MSDTTPSSYIGKYLIHEELGRGGFGTVYRATDITLDRVVALKILDPLLTRDPSFLERFHREARGAARLEHPNIVPVYEVGEAEGRSFIAMKYLPGRSLDKVLVEGRLPVERTLHILAQVATALDFAHSKGLIHRDVKPSNILVGPDELTGDPDHATLTDFGLARSTDQSVLTSLGHALGTPAYMAPEQLDVDRQEQVGPASDIYSFAVVAYEMLAGRPPFVGPTPAVMAAHLTKEPPPIAQFNTEMPAGLWEVLKAGLLKGIAGRPQRAADMVTALEAAAIEADRLARFGKKVVTPEPPKEEPKRPWVDYSPPKKEPKEPPKETPKPEPPKSEPKPEPVVGPVKEDPKPEVVLEFPKLETVEAPVEEPEPLQVVASIPEPQPTIERPTGRKKLSSKSPKTQLPQDYRWRPRLWQTIIWLVVAGVLFLALIWVNMTLPMGDVLTFSYLGIVFLEVLIFFRLVWIWWPHKKRL